MASQSFDRVHFQSDLDAVNLTKLAKMQPELFDVASRPALQTGHSPIDLDLLQKAWQ